MTCEDWFRAGYRDGIEESVINRCRTSSALSDLHPYYIAGYKAGAVDWYRCRDDVEKSWAFFQKRLDKTKITR